MIFQFIFHVIFVFDFLRKTREIDEKNEKNDDENETIANSYQFRMLFSNLIFYAKLKKKKIIVRINFVCYFRKKFHISDNITFENVFDSKNRH